MKVINVTLENFRNVPNGSYDINGSNILLMSTNGKGKSNFLKAIQATMGLPVGQDAIKHGEKKAKVIVKTAEFKGKQPIEGTNYEFSLDIRKGKGLEEVVSLSVTAPTGIKDTRKSIVTSIAGAIELDYDFVSLSQTSVGRKEQVRIVKSLLSQEVQDELNKMELNNKANYDKRTEISREVKQLEALVAKSAITYQDLQTIKQPINTEKLQTKLVEAGAINQKVVDVEKRIVERDSSILEKKAELEKLTRELGELEEKNSSAKKWLKENPKVDITDVQNEMNLANENNAKYTQILALNTQKAELEGLKSEVENLTIIYEGTKQMISDAIKDCRMPIEGLSFTEDTLLYKDKVVSIDCISTAEIMLIESQLKMALTHTSVIFVQRGESLGIEKLKELQSVCGEDYQIIMEKVAPDVESLKIEIMPVY